MTSILILFLVFNSWFQSQCTIYPSFTCRYERLGFQGFNSFESKPIKLPTQSYGESPPNPTMSLERYRCLGFFVAHAAAVLHHFKTNYLFN